VVPIVPIVPIVVPIKKRLETIYAKLGVNDRRAAVAEAAARGLIDPPAR
jgi:ATP/maltotriose-dependent transcriptional regulator MalT